MATIKLTDLINDLNSASFKTSVEAVEEKDGLIKGLAVVSAETKYGTFFYNAFFAYNREGDEFTVDTDQDFTDGLWHVEGGTVVNEDNEEVCVYDIPNGFPASASRIDWDAVRREINARR